MDMKIPGLGVTVKTALQVFGFTAAVLFVTRITGLKSMVFNLAAQIAPTGGQ